QKQKETSSSFIEENIEFASKQIERQLEAAPKEGKRIFPRRLDKGEMVYIGRNDWTSGFFPGSLWYLYELTGDEKWKPRAERYTLALDSVKFLTWHHDVGFMIGCSFGNGLRLTQNESYKDVIIQTAKSLCTRFRPGAGILQSWDTNSGWMSKRGWQCPVIIDNMMNLELLFEATQLSGDSSFYEIAVSHANVTLNNHYRDDYSCYHVLDFDTITGSIRHKHTAQGFAHESAWARGQSWGIYGFTVAYRETGNNNYLKRAEQALDFVLNHPNMPKDGIPYWDYDAEGIPNQPRDASAAAIMASAMYELSSYSEKKDYKAIADKIISSLASENYKAKPGENGNFILMHSVGSIPHGVEIDVPLNYADYYFLEALKRKRDLDM
ncbi:MAG: glycoside hydrolase family 88 protein, partial [Draconibacterium sp.]|nr:glycoside hydrolase family 88 protein [Draconibacterium sp.]